jgi:hypothetical protein
MLSAPGSPAGASIDPALYRPGKWSSEYVQPFSYFISITDFAGASWMLWFSSCFFAVDVVGGGRRDSRTPLSEEEGRRCDEPGKLTRQVDAAS